MTVQFKPYLYFRTECRDAMTHYREVFGGELELNSFGDFGMVGEGDPDLVLHASLTVSDGVVLQGGDVTAGSTARPGGSVQITGADETLLRGWFDALTDGGEVHMPLEQAAWGGMFGQGADRFGITWLFNVEQTAPVSR